MAESGETTVETLESVDIMQILRMIPHRYPMLLVDRVIGLKPGEAATGVKNVSINEPFFQGHFPSYPVMPGVLIVEAMAQTAGVVVISMLGTEAEGRLVYFMSIENCRFRKPVIPGDQMHIHVQKERGRANVWKFHCVAKVEGALAAEATVTAMILDR
ncbi:3-hydroxyacyl-ACP dehydratase FabZ [Zavarzinia compransoris]|uniref:3-hydroxyacyl-ACP dehydratase FabZ n=1 Tax=Zavarzinia marina TaxID=2911065 RepID=UPI001F331846|nr:3-hydroxyacyl-ACP dehydratase FabZ [Zavarzinia marina]MCF4164603.1 3-hydroxyacyl-ACP dehydratase FabZ [Zavarzinia marina]